MYLIIYNIYVYESHKQVLKNRTYKIMVWNCIQ